MKAATDHRLALQMHTIANAWSYSLEMWDSFQSILRVQPRPFLRATPIFDLDPPLDADSEVTDSAITNVEELRQRYYQLLSQLRLLHALDDHPLSASLVRAGLYKFALPSLAFVDPSCSCVSCEMYSHDRPRHHGRQRDQSSQRLESTPLSGAKSGTWVNRGGNENGVRASLPADAVVSLVCRRADVLTRVDMREAERSRLDGLVGAFMAMGPCKAWA